MAGAGSIGLLEGAASEPRRGADSSQHRGGGAAEPAPDAGGELPSSMGRGSDCESGVEDSSPRALQRALSDPQSPLFCALSSVPEVPPCWPYDCFCVCMWMANVVLLQRVMFCLRV